MRLEHFETHLHGEDQAVLDLKALHILSLRRQLCLKAGITRTAEIAHELDGTTGYHPMRGGRETTGDCAGAQRGYAPTVLGDSKKGCIQKLAAERSLVDFLRLRLLLLQRRAGRASKCAARSGAQGQPGADVERSE